MRFDTVELSYFSYAKLHGIAPNHTHTNILSQITQQILHAFYENCDTHTFHTNTKFTKIDTLFYAGENESQIWPWLLLYLFPPLEYMLWTTKNWHAHADYDFLLMKYALQMNSVYIGIGRYLVDTVALYIYAFDWEKKLCVFFTSIFSDRRTDQTTRTHCRFV